MSLSLANLKSFPKKKPRRIGRGNSGKAGSYAGRGIKGQLSRSGGKHKAGYLGKKFPPFIAQIPKMRGFKTIHPKFNIVNLKQLVKEFNEGELITPHKLCQVGIIDKVHPGVKILGKGTLTKKFTVFAHHFSKSAENAIKKAGGKIQIIETKK